MVEFTGYLTGAAEKYYRKKVMVTGIKLIFFSLGLLLPVVVWIVSMMQFWGFLTFYLIFLALSPLLAFALTTKKLLRPMTPRKITVEDEYIVVVADKCTESKLIADAKVVRDYGTFYDIVYPFGNYSEKYVCQKDLLTKGSLEEFEALFEGKIERKQGKAEE